MMELTLIGRAKISSINSLMDSMNNYAKLQANLAKLSNDDLRYFYNYWDNRYQILSEIQKCPRFHVKAVADRVNELRAEILRRKTGKFLWECL